MAEILPSVRVNMPQPVEAVVEKLARLPDRWKVYLGWPELVDILPDLLIVSPEGRMAFVGVSSASAALIDTWSRDSVRSESSPIVLRRLDRAIRALEARVFPTAQPLLFLTNVSEREMSALFRAAISPAIQIVGARTLDLSNLMGLFGSLEPCPERIAAARAYIGRPSRVLPKMLVPRPSDDLDSQFLDPVQEEWLRRYLRPPEDTFSSPATMPTGAYLLTGVAGCGKSLLLLYRAVLEKKQAGAKPLLFVTHNNALIRDLQEKVRAIEKELGVRCEIRIQQFFSWAHDWFCRPGDRWPCAVAYDERNRLVAEVSGTSAPDALKFYSDEFAWILDNGVSTLEDYKYRERVGRKRALQAGERARVWPLFEKYLALLEKKQKTDFPGLVLKLLAAAQSGRCPTYSSVFVDEAQFFSPMAMRVLGHAVAPDGRIFFAADPTQGFLQRKTPWVACGFDLSGRRSMRLRKPYRSTKGILGFAKAFYVARTSVDHDGEINLPSLDDLEKAPAGPAPSLLRVSHVQDEIREARSHIQRLVAKGIAPRDILVLHKSSSALNAIGEGEGWKSGNPKVVTADDHVRVSTFDAATGLEALYVILLGLRPLLEEEKNPLLDQEREQLEIDNTRKLYMSFTRAGYRLAIFWSGNTEIPGWLAALPSCP